MNSFVSDRFQPTRPDACGLAALLENGGRVPLPLRAVDVRFEVSGDCAEVRLQQEFEHEGECAVDVVYAFPLPSDASVYECVMTIGERRVVALVKPAAEARADYDGARRAGKRAALVEGVRENLFELHLGNVQPGDAIRIDFSYAQALAGEDSCRQLRIPVCPGLRYVPGKALGADGGTDLVPDAGRLARARIGSGHPDAAVFFCAGKLSGASDLDSPSHEIERVDSGTTSAVMLSGDVECPDRDFVLTWTAGALTTALASAGDPQQVICTLSANGIEDHEPEGREILFLLDSSASMDGVNWIGLLHAMELALQQLRASDRFSIQLFNTDLVDLSGGWKSVRATSLAESMAGLLIHQPQGGTNFTQAFATVVGQAAKLRRPVVVVITDGQFGDEDRATRVARDCGVEVHTFGIDANVNEGVLRKIARRTHGTCSLVSPGQELADKVRCLMEWLLAPSIHRIRPVGPWGLVGCPPSLRNGQSALVAFRHNGSGEVPDLLEVELVRADGSLDRQSFPVKRMEGPAASVLASRLEIESMFDEGRDHDAVALACQRNILAPGASFVAVDEAEGARVATAIIEQANLEPNSLQSFLLQDGGPGRGESSDAGTSLGFVTLGSATRGRDTRLYCLPPAAKAPAKASPPRPLHPSPADPLPSPSPRAEGRGGDLLERINSISCFERAAWQALAAEVLLPWAANSRVHERLLRELVSELLSLGDQPAVRNRALEILRGILPYLSQPFSGKLEEFIAKQALPA